MWGTCLSFKLMHSDSSILNCDCTGINRVTETLQENRKQEHSELTSFLSSSPVISVLQLTEKSFLWDGLSARSEQTKTCMYRVN